MDTKKFIEKAQKIHGDKYDYSKVEYKGYRTKVCIICPKHGEFWQKPAQHLSGKNCRACAAEECWSGKKITKEEFIKRAIEKHDNKYNYSKVDFIDMYTKVCIICPIHGEFWQTPKAHLLGGCNECANIIRRNNRRSNKDEFIKKAKEIHGDKYDYSKVEYVNANTKVCIICPEHGEFWQTPSAHLHYGCQKCSTEIVSANRRWKNEFFIEQILKQHGNKYDISKTRYINSRTPIEFICSKHGIIKDSPSYFLKFGCRKCNEERKNSQKILDEKNKNEIKEKLKIQKINEKHEHYLGRFKKAHNDKYDYSKIGIIRNKSEKVCIVCPKHGEFWQLVAYHANGCECPKCANEKKREKLLSNKDEFIEKAQKIHGGKYDYSKVEYKNSFTKVCIICPKHGEFWQTPSMHISERQGCPECGTLSSNDENDLYNFIHNELGIKNLTKREKNIIYPKELDIYIQSHNLAIEYDGIRWHSEKFNKNKMYHLNKTLECRKKNIGLIHIFEDEWVHNKEIVKHKLKHILNCDNDLPKIYARKCTIKEIEKTVCDDFLEKFHIQGKAISSYRIGAFYNNQMIGVMTFLKTNINDEFILNRFVTDYNYKISGVGGKLFKYFIKKYNPSLVVSFADRRWTINENDNLYTKLGFELNEILNPDYRYYLDTSSKLERIHKFNFRKQILHKKYGFDLSMTENEMANKLKAYKIWDCGLFKYVWTKENNLEKLLTEEIT